MRTRRLHIAVLAASALAGCRRTRVPSFGDASAGPGDAGDAAVAGNAAVGEPSLRSAIGSDLGGEGFGRPYWTASGAIGTLLGRRFFWTRPGDGDASARTTVIPEDTTISGLVVARNADVAIVTAGVGIHAKASTAYVFRDGRLTSTFPLSLQSAVREISDDGARVVASGDEDEVYEVASGKRLLAQRGVLMLSRSGEWALSGTAIASARDGAVAVSFARPLQYQGWVGAVAVGWSEEGLTIADPAARTVRLVAAPCKQMDGEPALDVTGARAARACDGILRVVNVDTASVTSVGLRRGPTPPDIAFARDDGAVLVWWPSTKRRPVRVDLRGRKLEALPALPPRRGDETDLQSPDGRFTIDGTAGGVRVVDAAGHEVAMWGRRPGVSHATSPVHLVVHPHGLEVVAQLARGRAKTLLGPPVVEAEPSTTRCHAAECTDPAFTDRVLDSVPGARVMEDAAPFIVATASSFIVAVTNRAGVNGVIVARGDGRARTTFQAWIGGGLAWLPDGRVEAFGDAESTLLCLDDAGIARPFASCRMRYEAKGEVRIE